VSEAVISSLSQKRFETYLVASGFNRVRALELYLWNARLGASFHLPIQAVEVALRNCINHAFVSEFGQDWWDQPNFLRLIDTERLQDITQVKRRLSRRGLVPETGQIVATLSFGFWVGVLRPRYNPIIWGRHLRTSFPSLPLSKGRKDLCFEAGKIARFRNRISHHEPLLKENTSQLHSDLLRLLAWLCPEKSAWIKPNCEAPILIRLKP
jgi:hypothetical protein